MEVEGECPECGQKMGLKIDDSVATLFSDTVKRMMDKDGNAVYCSNPSCPEGYVEPEDIEIQE